VPPINAESSQAGPSTRFSISKIAVAVLRLAIAGAILTYLYRSGFLNLRPLAKLLTAWPISIAGIAILLLDVLLMGIRTCWMLRPFGWHLPISKSFQLSLVASFFSNVLPGAAGGDLARLFYATKGNKHHRLEVATVMLLDRGVGLFSILVLPLLFAPFFAVLLRSQPVLRNLLIIDAVTTGAMLLSFLFCVHNGPVRRVLTLAFSRWPSLQSGAERVLDSLGAYREYGDTLLACFVIALVTNFSVIAVMALAFMALNPAWLSTKMLMAVPMGLIANCLPLTPGGLGVGEAAFHSLFAMNGLQGGVEAVLCWRIWKAVVGLPGLGVYLGGLGRVVFDAPQTPIAEVSEK